MVTSAKDCMCCNHGNPTMINNPNPLLSKAEWCRYCIHLTYLNLNNFKVVEAMGLKVITSTSPAMTSLPSKFHSVLSTGSKLTRWDTQADRVVT
jgi:hypothetical protein